MICRYRDHLRQLHHDYKKRGGGYEEQCIFLNKRELAEVEEMQALYLNVSLKLLTSDLEKDINNSFRSANRVTIIMFVIYMACLIVIYVIFWVKFMFDVQEALWKTKSILCIISPDIILNISEIKSFIFNNSSAVFFSKMD